MQPSLRFRALVPLALCGLPQVSGAPPQCPAGATARLTVVNNCGEDVWMIETPPGSQASVQAQWDWFLDYATVTNPLPNGAKVAGVLLPMSTSQSYCVPDKGAPGGNFRFYMGCPNNKPFDLSGCIIGATAGDLSAINTLFEPTFGCSSSLSGLECAFNPAGPDACQHDPGPATCPPVASADNFDISAVDGYTIPMKVEAQPAPGQTCNRFVTDASMLDLASCPEEDKTTLYSSDPQQQALIEADAGISLSTQDATGLRACTAPFKWFQTASLGTPVNPAPSSGECNPIDRSFNSSCFYSGAGCDEAEPVTMCPGRSGPQQKVGPKGDGTLAIQNTHWVQQLYALGYGGYTWQYGDGVGDQACGWGTELKLTLCPNGGVPYRKNQLWTFAASAGTCSTDGSTGAPDGVTTFGSLAACQQAKMRYTCDDLTQSDPFKVPAALWKADPAATRSNTGFAYAQIQGIQRLVQQTLMLDIPGFGALTLPESNYFYTTGNTTCPPEELGAPRPHPVAFQGNGKAKSVAHSRAHGKLSIKGSFTLPRAIEPNEVVLTIWRLLADAESLHDFVSNGNDAGLLPLILDADDSHRARPFSFATPPGARPQVKLRFDHLDPAAGATRFSLSVRHAAIAEPVECIDGRPEATARLETRFSLHDASDPVTVGATLHWRCLPHQLKTP